MKHDCQNADNCWIWMMYKNEYLPHYFLYRYIGKCPFLKKNFRRSFSVEETQDKSLCIDIQLTFVGKPSNEMSRFHTYID